MGPPHLEDRILRLSKVTIYGDVVYCVLSAFFHLCAGNRSIEVTIYGAAGDREIR